MSEPPEIIDLHKVIEPELHGDQIESYKSSYLTKPGDNYGSVMLSISTTIKRSNGESAVLPLIAKLPPLTNDLYWQIFQPERTCVSENAVYKYLLPELTKLQIEVGVAESDLFDGFSRYYGSRISLDSNATKVDRNAVLVLENLNASGYKPGDRHRPYDCPHTLLALKYMAQYHALPIAMRLQKPDVYNICVRPFFKKFNIGENITAEDNNTMLKETLQDIRSLSDNSETIVERVEQLFEIFDTFQKGPEVKDGPYNSIVHSDLWINNIMIKYGEDGTPKKLKIVDFQIAQYESVVHDIIFFLLSSVDNSVLESHFETFLQTYYEELISCLQRIRVETQDYSFDGFLNEVKRAAYIQIPHALMMTKVIMADNSTIPKDYKDMNLSVLSKNTGLTSIVNKMGEILRLANKFGLLF